MPASCVRWFAGFAPRIWAVEAVGIGATSSEFRTPCSATSARSSAQFQRSVGVTPHMSGWNTPLLTGEPAYLTTVVTAAQRAVRGESEKEKASVEPYES